MKSPESGKFRLAIVVPKHPSGEIGGAERFYFGLNQAMLSRGIDSQILEVASDERDIDAIKESYLRFYDLDLSGFDGVISTKAPTYLIGHSNHVCYLVHTMRVFYDLFEREFPPSSKAHQEQRDFILKADLAALSPPRVKKLYVIGKEVGDRMETFLGLSSSVLRLATPLTGFHSRSYDYVFIPSRLHRWKRIDLIIEAMRHLRSRLSLLIAGSGEDEEELRMQAKGNEQVEFLGRISDDQLIDLYSRALVVPFVPIGEDYGYVTLEAFKSEKPVITCRDSGEPANMVEDGVSGFVCAPEPEAIAEKIDFFAEDEERAKEMGRAGLESVSSITWSAITDELLDTLGVSDE